jgi:hypothetical protein
LHPLDDAHAEHTTNGAAFGFCKCRAAAPPPPLTTTRLAFLTLKNKLKIIRDNYCFVLIFFVPLHREKYSCSGTKTNTRQVIRNTRRVTENKCQVLTLKMLSAKKGRKSLVGMRFFRNFALYKAVNNLKR